METSEELWKTPASIQPTNKRVDIKYFVPPKDNEFLFARPQVNSLVVESAQQRSKLLQYRTGNQDKDHKKLDLFGKKILFFHLTIKNLKLFCSASKS